MKDLLIICAGGFGKEALSVALSMNISHPTWNILGFLDDTIPVGTEVSLGYKVVGGIQDWEPQDNQYFAMGISSPKSKEKIYNIIHAKGATFATLISYGTYIPPDATIGEGSIIPLAWLGPETHLGKCVHICGSMVGESTIGDFSTTTGFANIASATLGKRVFVGSHAVVLNNIRVGDDANISAGSIVFKHVKPGTTVYGNPARELKI